MKPNQIVILIIAFFIAPGVLFLSGCKTPLSFPEAFDISGEDSLQAGGEPADPDSAAESAKRKPLTLIINNLASPKAPVRVVFYEAKHEFLSKTDRLKGYKFIPDGEKLTVQIKNIEYGEYAFAAYQDVNSDGKCNRNKIGVPKEPYGFSRDFKPFLKQPRFDDCKFAYNEKEHTITMTMLR